MTTSDTDAEIERLRNENETLRSRLRSVSHDLSRAQGLIDAKFPYRVPAILNQIQTDIAGTLASKYKEHK